MKCQKHGLRWILAAYKAYIDFITIWWYYNYSESIACIYPDLTQILVARHGLKLFQNHTWLKREMYLSDFFSDGLLVIGEVLVVAKNSCSVRWPLDVVSPFIQCSDNCKEFSVVDVVVSFGRGKCFGDKRDGMSVTISIELHEDCTSGIFRGVCLNLERFRVVRHSEDWLFSEFLF